MSLVGTSFGKFAGAVGGAPTTGGIIGAGLLVGVFLGASVGVVPDVAGPQPSVAQTDVYPCPNVGPPLMAIESGQHVLVTGKSADGQWFEILYPSGGLDRAWVLAGAYSVLGGASADDIPVTECDPAAVTAFDAPPAEAMTDIGSFEPTPTPPPTSAASSAPTPTPSARATPAPAAAATATPKATPKPTPKPTPKATPAPTPTPDATPPRVTNPGAKPSQIISVKCGGPEASKVTVSASDAGGVKSIVLAWSGPGVPSGSKAMSLSGSTGTATLSISGDGLFANTTYTLVATARDNAGNKATSGGGSLEVLGCIT